jgi:hypothetical protein
MTPDEFDPDDEPFFDKSAWDALVTEREISQLLIRVLTKLAEEKSLPPA